MVVRVDAPFGMRNHMKSLTVLLVLAASGPALAALRKTVSTDYTLLRRGPHSYVVGTGYRGWTVDVQQDASEGYRWGHIYGALNACLWIFQDAVTPGGAEVPAACRSDNRTLPDEAFLAERYGGQDDGAGIFVTVDANACPTWDGVHITGFGNVRPWQDATEPSEPLQTLVPLGGQVLRRYLTRDRRFVMVRDPQLGATDGVGLQSWFFVPASCLTDQPPPPPPVDAAPPPPPVDAAPPPPPLDAALPVDPPTDAAPEARLDPADSAPLDANDLGDAREEPDFARDLGQDSGTEGVDGPALAGSSDCQSTPGPKRLAGLLLLLPIVLRRRR